MSVRKHGNRWQVRIRIGGGRRHEETLPPGATIADARALEAARRREAIDAQVGRKPRRSIADAIDEWQPAAERLRSWRKDLRYRFPILRKFAGTHPLHDLPTVAETLKRASLAEGLSAPAINRYLALYRRLGNLAERWGWTDAPLGRRVVLLPENSQRHVYLTRDQVRALCAETDAVTADMIRFAVLTGLRRGEMLGLRKDQLRGDLLVLDARTKSGRPRGVPMPPEAARIARKRLPWEIGDWVLRDRFEAAREAAKLPHVRWHDLRHTYASWLAQNGQPMTAIRDLMGHSSLAVTHRYAHLAPDHLRAAVASLGGGVGTGRGKKRVAKQAKKAA